MRACTLCRRLFADEVTSCPDDESPTHDAAIEPLPSALAARFPGAQPFAQGDMGTLYRSGAPASGAGDAQSFRVLKVLAVGQSGDAAGRAHIRRELRKQLSLIHPQLPRVIEEGESDGRVWFLREHAPGQSLAAALRRGAFAPDRAYSVIAQLADALDALHRVGLVHRDLKPGHVLVQTSARGPAAQLIDATLAAPLHPTRAEPRGTVDYIAPEVLDGAAATFRSDLYALGCLSYELLSGAPPFRGVTPEATLAARRSGAAPEWGEAFAGPVRTLVASMLAADPRKRPFSAQQVRRTIEALPSPQPSTVRAGRRRSQPLSSRKSEATVAPVAPEATVELDVDELERVMDDSDVGAPTDHSDRTQELDVADIEALEVTARPAPVLRSAPTKQPPRGPVDEDAPTIALDTGNTSEVLAAMRPRAQAAGGAAAGAPRTSGTGTHFGLGPVRDQDIAAAEARAAAVDPDAARGAEAPSAHEPGRPQANAPTPHGALASAAAGSQLSPLSPGASRTTTERAGAGERAGGATARRGYAPVPESVEAPRGRHRPKPVHHAARLPFGRSPSLLLWASAALVPLVLGVRALRGPSGVATRSDSIIVHVPRAPLHAQQVPSQAQDAEEGEDGAASGRALIGGDVARATSRRLAQPAQPQPPSGPVGAPDQPESSDDSATSRQALPALVEPDEPGARSSAHSSAEPSAGLGAQPSNEPVSTVSALQVGRALARAAQARPGFGPEVDQKARARQLYRARRYHDAAEAYRSATVQDSADAAAFAGLGASLLAAGDTGRAITAYQRAVQLQPDVSGFQAALGRAYLYKGDRARARAAYAKAVALDPSNQAARSGMASTKAR